MFRLLKHKNARYLLTHLTILSFAAAFLFPILFPLSLFAVTGFLGLLILSIAFDLRRPVPPTRRAKITVVAQFRLATILSLTILVASVGVAGRHITERRQLLRECESLGGRMRYGAGDLSAVQRFLGLPSVVDLLHAPRVSIDQVDLLDKIPGCYVLRGN